MGLTIVLSGSEGTRRQAVNSLKQAGFQVDDDDHSHGWEKDGEVSFITAHGDSVDAAQAAVQHLSWQLRQHWHRTGDWQKVPGVGKPEPQADPLVEIEKLKAQLRAAGVFIPGE